MEYRNGYVRRGHARIYVVSEPNYSFLKRISQEKGSLDSIAKGQTRLSPSAKTASAAKRALLF